MISQNKNPIPAGKKSGGNPCFSPALKKYSPIDAMFTAIKGKIVSLL
jgi:hypothetical protein